MPKNDRVRLRHMLDAAQEAVAFAREASREQLEYDRKLTLALVKAVEIIGEAAYQISENTRKRFSEIPWEDIIGMRPRLVHAYFEIDLDVLWSTVQHDLPSLIFALQKALHDLEQG